LIAARIGAAGVIALVIVAAPAAAGEPAAADAHRCHVIRGRLAVWNGTPAIRIWPVGTRRELGVVDAHGDAAGDMLLPAPVRALIEAASDSTVVFGDYRVCALTEQRPGRMQIVYIAEASHLRAEKR
jgi:hypothetical protein